METVLLTSICFLTAGTETYRRPDGWTYFRYFNIYEMQRVFSRFFLLIKCLFAGHSERERLQILSRNYFTRIFIYLFEGHIYNTDFTFSEGLNIHVLAVDDNTWGWLSRKIRFNLNVFLGPGVTAYHFNYDFKLDVILDTQAKRNSKQKPIIPRS